MVKIVSVIVKGESQYQDVDEFLQKPKRRTTVDSFLRRKREDQFEGPATRNIGDLPDDMARKLLAILA